MTLRSSADACGSNRTSVIMGTLTVYRKNILNDWQPPKQGPDLEPFIGSKGSDIASHKTSKLGHDNLTKSERCALYDLLNRQVIIIKPADKGSAEITTS